MSLFIVVYDIILTIIFGGESIIKQYEYVDNCFANGSSMNEIVGQLFESSYYDDATSGLISMISSALGGQNVSEQPQKNKI